ncbi:methylenetetrahydrofolate dehydrogenase [Alkalihalophilus pseudofirmus OF4]|uniref:Bifunctional protein FolD n=1 Tax=Alkalihalophilus pseudofirmus (strain ATCC BAA-2126 / JCM 17055 / OF4) TaxID=398511 RepID=D3FUU7_ALKPO|nr:MULTISPECIES: bifunctional methylenetetrahydrofolate dehydrogenase/methenyltetrahydrofolate cyclohydrolase FolD [Alkalihalophilus]ADC48373.1 methylenetetrahydrofolate dehydrogenase [Alkalihalophilus pseudofirmus OF4]MED1601130.1 bifunctional methylenetetrahydrofolate dehydrogenase/methenyltetrahydrofolate cyclohydrolase FolD [Alkalihalophilus marmarensis]
MSAALLNGKELAAKKRETMKKEVSKLIEAGIKPGLAVILVGDNQASKTYVRSKQKACEQIGIHSVLTTMPEDTPEEVLLAEIDRLNEDPDIDGILVQLPLPSQISERAVIERIAPEKDVDGFHPVNIGRMMTKDKTFLPCTPFGIVEMLKEADIQMAGKHVVVVGRSNIVGKPVGQLLLNEDATVTYCHSRTDDIANFTKQADILIVAVGRAKMIKASDVKEGAVVVDVGMNREDGKLCGDVDFDEVREVASHITPVPGGVGPMTITMLLENTIQSAKERA